MARRSAGIARKVRITYGGTNPSAAAVTIKKDGTTTTDAVGAAEQLIVTDFELIAETGGAVEILGGTGVQIEKGTLPTTGGGIAQTKIERRCLKGSPPTVTAAAGGRVDLTMNGNIISAPTT